MVGDCLSNQVFSEECTKPLPTYQLIQCFQAVPCDGCLKKRKRTMLQVAPGRVMDVSWVELWCWWIIVFFGVRDFPVKRWTMIILNQNFVKLHPFSSQKSQPCFSGEARKQVWRAGNVPFLTEQNGDVGVHLESRAKVNLQVVWNQMRKIQVSTTYSSTYKEYVLYSSIYTISGNTLNYFWSISQYSQEFQPQMVV